MKHKMHTSYRLASQPAQWLRYFLLHLLTRVYSVGGNLLLMMRSCSFCLILTGLCAAVSAAAGGPVTVSAASGTAPVAPGSIVSIYGANMATNGLSANVVPLPTNLGGTTATITDSAGFKAVLPLFYAGPTQINAQIPAGVHTGPATIAISAPSGSQTGTVQVAAVAPGMFSANQTGKDVAAADIVTNTGGGSQTVGEVADCRPGTCVGIPLDVSSGQAALVLYGTGVGSVALSSVSVQIGSQTLPASYAGPAPTYVGLDQVNVMLPASLAGSGTVNVTVLVAGTPSNVLTVNIAQNTTSISCAGCTAYANPPYSFPADVVAGNCSVASLTRVSSSTLLPPTSWSYTANMHVWTAGYPDVTTDVDQLLIATVAPDGTMGNTTCLSCTSTAPSQDLYKHSAKLRSQGDWILLDVENSDGPVITQQSSQQLQVQRNNGYWSNLWVTNIDGSQWYQLTNFNAPSDSPGAVGMLNPLWSPDGTMVIFPATYQAPSPPNLQGFWTLYVANFGVNSSGVPYLYNYRNITYPGDIFYEMQDVAPDNSQLLVQSTANEIYTYGVDIYAVSLVAGPGFGAFTDLTNSPYSWDEHSVYSPNQQKIAWISSLPFPNLIPEYGNLHWVDYRDYLHNEMFLMNVDGTDVQQLTHFNDPTAPEYSPQFGDALYAIWSLDGTQLMIYSGTAEVQVPGGNSQWLLTFTGACGGS
jgi:uncharacterized protein (TIGR03437 family)